MHLFEVYEATLINPRETDVSPEEMGAVSQSKKQIGAGAFSTVMQDEDPHTVTKMSRGGSALQVDAYWIYLDEIEKRNLMDNPHFPRFYVKKVRRDENGNVIQMGVEMEKLYKLNQMSFEEGLAMFNRLFGDPRQNKVLSTLINRVENKGGAGMKSPPIEYLVPLLVGYVHRAVKVEENDEDQNVEVREIEIKDDTFRNAVEEIIEIQRDWGSRLYLDIKKENLMLRKTQYGPQLVFADPYT